MNRRDIIIAILIAGVLLTVVIAFVWRDTNGKVVDTTLSVVQDSTSPERDISPLESGVLASWYNYSLKGAPNYSTYTETAASRDYPKGTYLQVWTDEKIIVVRVNDYGPEEWTGRDIDLSSYAFSKLAPLSKGIITVRIRPL